VQGQFFLVKRHFGKEEFVLDEPKFLGVRKRRMLLEKLLRKNQTNGRRHT
jgi:hypothetical protein